MDSAILAKLALLIFASSLFIQSRGDGSGSVVFLDGATNRYIRDRPLDDANKINSMSLSEVAATVSVLLGFAPSPSLSADSSQKLNEILLPDPFNKPHAVFMLEVSGAADLTSQWNGKVLKNNILGSSKAQLQLPGGEVSIVDLDEPLDVSCDAACIDGELSNLASLLGGSYVGTLKSLDGTISVPLASGGTLNLHVKKQGDLQFLSSLISLVRNVKKAVENHEDLAGSSVDISEILTGRFTGIEVLREVYGESSTLRQGMEVVEKTVTQLFNLLQVSYKGKIAGVIVSTSDSSNLGIVVDAVFQERISRMLEEESSSNTTIYEVLLVRRSLAWITGLILLISTFIGIYLLLNMPLTRDTLLYSNVKLD